MRGEGLMEGERTTPSFTFVDITAPNDKLVFMKKFNESRVRQSMTVYLLGKGRDDKSTTAYRLKSGTSSCSLLTRMIQPMRISDWHNRKISS